MGLALVLFAGIAGRGEPTAEELVERFVVGARKLWNDSSKGLLTRDEYLAAIQELRMAEAEHMRPVMPEVLNELGVWLGRVAESEKEIDRLLDRSHMSEEESHRLDALLRNPAREDYVPRCAIALQIGVLGRDAPERASTILLGAVPLPERSEDECVLGALASVGPPAYETIAAVVERERNTARMWVGMTALLAQAKDTAFPHLVGLGSVDQWDTTYPTSRRGLRRLARSWMKWWPANGDQFEWDSEAMVLKQRAVK